MEKLKLLAFERLGIYNLDEIPSEPEIGNYMPESIYMKSDYNLHLTVLETSNLNWEIGHLLIIMYIIFTHSLYIGFNITLHPILIVIESITIIESIIFLIVQFRKNCDGVPVRTGIIRYYKNGLIYDVFCAMPFFILL